MTQVIEEIKVEVSNNCRCTEYDEETGDTKLDADGDPVPANECFGCWNEMLEDFEAMILQPWLAKKNLTLDDSVAVYFKGVSWQSISGSSKISANKIIDALRINGDYTLRFTLKGNKLTCIRSSHDEYGASFKFLKN
jgi:hypothetical protein